MGLFKVFCLFLVALLGMSDRADTPEGAINAFVAAINRGDLSTAATYVVGGKPKTDFTSMKQVFQGLNLTISDLKVTTSGDRSTATYQVVVEMPGQPKTDQRESISLVKVDDDWLLVPAGQGSSGREALPSFAMMTTTDLTGIFANAKKAAQKTACLSNIKQLALGVLIYLADHDDKFTMDSSRLKATLNPYLKNDRIWYCPNGSKTIAAYSLNSRLLKKSAVDIEEPANTVMVYEGTKGKLDFRHAGFAAVGFADGHAKMINEETAKKLRWNP